MKEFLRQLRVLVFRHTKTDVGPIDMGDAGHLDHIELNIAPPRGDARFDVCRAARQVDNDLGDFREDVGHARSGKGLHEIPLCSVGLGQFHQAGAEQPHRHFGWRDDVSDHHLGLELGIRLGEKVLKRWNDLATAQGLPVGKKL